MNKVFKVVWSKAKNCYVVTSELAKRNTKGSQLKGEVSNRGGLLADVNSTTAFRAAMAAAILTGALSVPQLVKASFVVTPGFSNNTDYDTINDYSYSIFKNGSFGSEREMNQQASNRPSLKSVYINPSDRDKGSNVEGDLAVAIGWGARTVGSGGVAIGYNALTMGDINNVAVGPATIANGRQSVVLGSYSYAGTQATGLGNDVYAIGYSSIAIGSDDISAYTNPVTGYDVAHYFGSLYADIDSRGQKYGYVVGARQSDGTYQFSRAAGEYGIRNVFSPTLAQGPGAIAIGSRSLAFDAGATAVGTLAFALKRGSTAIGTETRAEGLGALAFGNNTYVFADNSIGVGSSSQILNIGGTAYGYKTYSGGENSIAIGRDVYSNIQMTLGKARSSDGANVFSGDGLYNIDPTKGAKSILDNRRLDDNSVRLSHPSLDRTKTYIENLERMVGENPSSGIGLKYLTANLTDKNGVENVIQKSGVNAIVVGSRSAATGDNGIALGRGAIVLGNNSFALGSYSMATNKNSMSIGLASRTTDDNAIAIGTASAAMGENSLAVGSGTINYGARSTVVGARSGIAKESANSLLIGSQGLVGRGISNSIAIGNGAGVGNYVQGPDNTIYRVDPNTGDAPKKADGSYYSLSDVSNPETLKKSGILTRIDLMLANAGDDGHGTTVGLMNAIAIGNNARVFSKKETPNDGDTLYTTTRQRFNGRDLATEDGRNAMAIGNGAQAWLENSLALGVNSKTDYTPQQLATDAWRTPDAIAVNTTSNVGIISVGSLGGERRIVNVAAGAYDTDAVNVSQLKQLYESIQRQVNGSEDANGLHYIATNDAPPVAGEHDYVAKNNIQNSYSRYVNTYKEYKSYLVKEAYGGATLTDTARAGYNAELSRLEKAMVAEGLSLETLKRIQVAVAVGQDNVQRDGAGNITSFTTDVSALKAEGATVSQAIGKLDTKLAEDLNALKQQNNNITGLSTAQIAEGLLDINYTNSQAKGVGSIAIGYKTKAHATESTALGALAKVGQLDTNGEVTAAGTGGTAVGYNANVQAENGVALGRNSSVAVTETGSGAGVAYKQAISGITQTPNAGVVSVGKSGTSTRRIINVAAGKDDTDAVNVAQLKSLAAQKVTLSGNTGTALKAVLGEEGSTTYEGPTFTIKGDGTDISSATSTANSTNSLVFSLNKATTVTSNDTKAVTSSAVYTAIQGAKPSITGGTGVTVTKTAGAGIAGDEYVISFSGSTSANISYKASGEATSKTTTGSTGFVFTPAGGATGQSNSGNIKITTGDNGVVNFALSNTLQGVSSIGGTTGQGQISFANNNGITFGDATLTDFTDSDGNADAVVASTKQVAKAKTEVKASTGISLAETEGADGHKIYTISSTVTPTSLASDFAKKDGSNLVQDSTETPGTKVSALSEEAQTNWRTALDVYDKSTVDSKVSAINTNLDHTIGLAGNTNGESVTNAKKLSDGNIEFTIVGATDSGISTTKTAQGLSISLDKSGTVAAGDNKVVTGDTVNRAIDTVNRNIANMTTGLRAGTAGTMIYTAANEQGVQERLVAEAGNFYHADDLNTSYVKAADGQWYATNDVDAQTGQPLEGRTAVPFATTVLKTGKTAVDVAKINISAVNPDGTVTSATPIMNVKSTFTLAPGNGKADATVAGKVLNGDSEAATNTADRTGLLNLTGETLHNAATVGELQAVAQAGLDFAGDTQEENAAVKVHAPLGSIVNIVGGGYTAATADSYSADNLATFVDAAGKSITVKMKKTPTVEGLKLNKDNSTVTLTPSGSGANTKLQASNGSNQPIVLTGLKGDNSDESSAVTVAQLTAATAGLNGISSGGVDGTTGPAGKDGLNGQGLGSQLVSLRSGLAGPMVYTIDRSATDKTQTRLLTHDGKYYRMSDITSYKMANNGKWYETARVDESGNPTEGSEPVSVQTVVNGITNLTDEELQNVNISAVGANGSITETTVLKNIASGWTTRDSVGVGSTAGDGTGLYALSGTDLTQAATLGDLQKVAKAGLSFTGNNKTDDNAKYVTTTRALNETLAIKGGIEIGQNNLTSLPELSGENLFTKVDAENGTIYIQMKREPAFKSVTLGENGDVKLSATDDKLTLSKANTTGGKVSLSGLKDDPDDPTTAVTRETFDNLVKSLGVDGNGGADGVTGPQGIAGVHGAHGAAGPAGKDGLDGYSLAAKVEAQREGLSGNMVYTAKEDGSRLVKVNDTYYKKGDVDNLTSGKKLANDGKWYDATAVDASGNVSQEGAVGSTTEELVAGGNLQEVPKNKVQISTVNPNGETTSPTTIGNIASNLAAATPNATIMDGTDEAAKKQELNRIATVAETAMNGNPSAEEDDVLARKGLLNASGDVLNRAATVGDLQTAAQAGLSFTGNSSTDNVLDKVHAPLGSVVKIEGGTAYAEDTFASENLSTKLDSDSKKVLITMKKAPKFTGVTLDNEDSEHPAKVTLTPKQGQNSSGQTSPTLSLGGGTDGSEKVVLGGLTDGQGDDTAVTKGTFTTLQNTVNELNDAINGGNGANGANGNSSGAAGRDGLDGKSLGNKVQGLRDGLAGTMVYTDPQGERLIRENGEFYQADGLVKYGDSYYNASDIADRGLTYRNGEFVTADGTAVAESERPQAVALTNDSPRHVAASDVIISSVNPEEGATNTPTTVGNIKSTIGYNNGDEIPTAIADKVRDAKNAVNGVGEGDAHKTGLLEKAGADLNHVATVGDLQAVAQAGLDFTGNTGDAIHKALGSTLKVEGKSGATYSEASYDFDNVVTTNDNGVLRTALLRKPSFEGLVVENGKDGVNGKVEIGAAGANGRDGADGMVLTLSGKNGENGQAGRDGKVVLNGIADGTTPDSATTKGYVDKAIDGLNGTSGTNGLNGSSGANGANGTSTNGPAGQDGLNGQSLGAQVLAARDGLSGPVVYTSEAGERLVRDGENFYKAADVNGKLLKSGDNFYSIERLREAGIENASVNRNGQVVDGNGNVVPEATLNAARTEAPQRVEKVMISAVDPTTGSTVAPTPMSNVKSTIGYNNGDDIPSDDAGKVRDAKNAINGVGEGAEHQAGLLEKSGADLNRVATVGDLQAVAQAGLDFAGNTGEAIHKALGSTLKLEGKSGATYSEASYDFDNVVTTNDNGVLRTALLRKPSFEGLVVENGKDGVNGKVEIGAAGANGRDGADGMVLTLSGKNGENGAAGRDGKVVLNGIADGDSPDSATTKGYVDNAIDGLNGTSGTNGLNGSSGANGANGTSTNGPAGQDGLNGQSLGAQVLAARDGLSGPVVYTSEAGERLVRDGENFYKAADVNGKLLKSGDNFYSIENLQNAGVQGAHVDKDGHVVDENGHPVDPATLEAARTDAPQRVEKVVISAVDPMTGEPTTPTVMGNVKSTIGYNNGDNIPADEATKIQDAKNAINGVGEGDTRKPGLLEKTGADLNRVATVGDLQAVAQAGLDFAGNTGETIHKALGSTLKLEGKSGATYSEASYDFDNVVTTNDNGVLRTALLRKPGFEGLVVENGKDGVNGKVEIGASGANGRDGTDGMVLTLSGKNGDNSAAGRDGKVVLNGIADGTSPDSATTKGYVDNAIDGLNGTSGTNGLNGSSGANTENGTSTNGPAGQDGLNGQSLGAQVLAGRDGLSGAVVYTSEEGERLVRDGENFYKADDVNGKLLKSGDTFYSIENLQNAGVQGAHVDKDGHVVDENGRAVDPATLAGARTEVPQKVDNVIISAVDPKTGEPTMPTAMGNAKSSIGLDGLTPKLDEHGNVQKDANGHTIMVPQGPIGANAAQEAVRGTDGTNPNGGLLGKSGAALNRVATVGDLQAVAQAGLDFNGNEGTTSHRPLGTALAIKGADANTTWGTAFSDTNLMTKMDGNTVRLGMKTSPSFTSVIVGTNGTDGKTGTVLTGKDGKLYVNGDTVITGNTSGFYIKNGDKKIEIKAGDTVDFNSYLQVTPTANTNTGSGNNAGNGSAAGSATGTRQPVGTVDVVVKDNPTNDRDIINKGYLDKQLTPIKDAIKNGDIVGQGTIGTGQDSDKKVISGEAVKQYLDKNYTSAAEINRRMSQLAHTANAGTASAMAAAAIPQITNMYDDDMLIGAGMGSYGGQTAIAIGVSGTNDNRDRVYRISTTYDSTGRWGLSAGIGFTIGSGANTPKPALTREMNQRIEKLEAENAELRTTNKAEIQTLTDKNDKLQREVEELQAMLQQLLAQSAKQ